MFCNFIWYQFNIEATLSGGKLNESLYQPVLTTSAEGFDRIPHGPYQCAPEKVNKQFY
jgi:hypothetical protein